MRLRRRSDNTGPPTGVGVGLVVASSMVPGTFARSLSARSTLDQGIITGLSTGLHYLLTVGTQDVLQAASAEVTAGRPRRGAGDARLARKVTLAADLAAIPIGLALRSALPERPGEAMLRGTLRQVGWRFAVTGIGASLLIGTETVLERLDRRVGAGGQIARLPVAVPIGLAVAFVLEHRRQVEQEPTAEPADERIRRCAAPDRDRRSRGRRPGAGGVLRARPGHAGRSPALGCAPRRAAAVEADRSRRMPRGAGRRRLQRLRPRHAQDRGRRDGRHAGHRVR